MTYITRYVTFYSTDREKHIPKAIESLELQRSVLGDSTVEAAIAPLKKELDEFFGGNSSLTGERKPVTIMFADISGFTAMAENMDPEDLRDLMNAGK